MPTIYKCSNQLLNCSAGPEARKAFAIDFQVRKTTSSYFLSYILLYAPWYNMVNLTVAFVLVFGALSFQWFGSFQKTWSIKKYGEFFTFPFFKSFLLKKFTFYYIFYGN